MMRKYVIVIALLLVVVSAGCINPSESSEPIEIDNNTSVNNDISVESSVPHSVDRFVDTEAGVVCYKFDDYQEGGISCVPVNSTELNITN